MSILSNTPVCDPSLTTDLGDAFDAHNRAHGGNAELVLGYPEPAWLNVMRARARTTSDSHLCDLTNRMHGMLLDPAQTGGSFREEFLALYDQAGRRAYPLAWSLRDEQHALAGITDDYTLLCFDYGIIRLMEDDAVEDKQMRGFVESMIERLRAGKKLRGRKVFPAVFEIYSEALVYHVLRERAGSILTISKIAEGDEPSPDFECVLKVGGVGREERELTFYIEVKTLDIVDAPQRLDQMSDEGCELQIEIERQQRQGRRLAMAERVIAPYRKFAGGPGYDSRSPRMVIETLGEKAARCFKSTQFRRGPTFALANLLRLPLMGQGSSALAPFYYEPASGGGCVSGVLWHLAFGTLGAPIHRAPEFEGTGTADGELSRAGLLVDQAAELPAAGLIVLHYDEGAYRLDGLFDMARKDDVNCWSNIETQEVLYVLCDDVNDRSNRRAYKYAHRQSRKARS
jgi:hypothetical protein